MNNDIKEILNKLKDINWYEELDLTGTMWIELTWEETHLLLNCITNLQERLHDTDKISCDRAYRINKATELINAWLEGLNNDDIIILLNNLGIILNGGK